MKKLILGSILGLLVAGVCFSILYFAFDQTRAFQAQAELGQPIVRAIEDYHKYNGSYPASLADLAPKYLAASPDVVDLEHEKVTGWQYYTITNGATISYRLRFNMGRGGVEYEPPDWFGNDEGNRTVILNNN